MATAVQKSAGLPSRPPPATRAPPKDACTCVQARDLSKGPAAHYRKGRRAGRAALTTAQPARQRSGKTTTMFSHPPMESGSAGSSSGTRQPSSQQGGGAGRPAQPRRRPRPRFPSLAFRNEALESAFWSSRAVRTHLLFTDLAAAVWVRRRAAGRRCIACRHSGAADRHERLRALQLAPAAAAANL